MENLFSLCEWKGKTHPILISIRQSIRKQFREILYSEAALGDLNSETFCDRDKQLQNIARWIGKFLDFANKSSPPLISYKWELQKEKLLLLVTTLREFHGKPLFLEEKLFSGGGLNEIVNDKNLKLATIQDFHTLKKISEGKKTHCLALPNDLSEKEKIWLTSLVWMKTIHRTNHCSDRDSSFIYPSEGLVASEQFDTSSSSCSDGLHVTFFANYENFGSYGDLFLFVQIPISVDVDQKCICGRDRKQNDETKKKLEENQLETKKNSEGNTLEIIINSDKKEITLSNNRMVIVGNALKDNSESLKFRVQYLNVLGERTWDQLEINYLPSFLRKINKVKVDAEAEEEEEEEEEDDEEDDEEE
jgi:hypothetical protein